MDKRYGLVIDLERCIGCQTCRIACKLENDFEKNSGITVETVGGPHQDTPAGVYPNLSMHYIPRMCMHCEKPPCVDACTEGAIKKRADGIVVLDYGLCNGCQICISECPYDALLFDDEKDLARKCTMCSHRVDEGLEPFCVLCCETEAMFFGDLNDPDSIASRMILERNASTLDFDKGTGPCIYYCPTRQGRIT